MAYYEPGTITHETNYIVICALCPKENNDFRPNQDEARKSFRLDGWSKTVKHGWLCPGCKESEQ